MWLVAIGVAHAGACCAGSTTTTPAVLGECEHVLVGLGATTEVTVARWDQDRALRPSSLREQALVGTLTAGGRWDRKGSAVLTLPARLDHRAAGGVSAWGLGPGDLRAVAVWDPFVEDPERRTPLPVFTGGLRLPTGTDWTEADQVLDADVTGLAEPAALLGVQVGRTIDRTPWSVGVDSELGSGPWGFRPTVTGSASVGRYVGTGASVLGTVRHTLAWSEGGRADRTAAGARLTWGRTMRGRVWLGGDADVPLPGLGRSAAVDLRVGAGAAWVR